MRERDRETVCEVRLVPAGCHLTVVLSGELDASSVGPLTELAAAIPGQYDHVSVDAAGLTFMGSTGLNALIALRKVVPSLSIHNATRPVRRVVEATGLVEYLDLRDS